MSSEVWNILYTVLLYRNTYIMCSACFWDLLCVIFAVVIFAFLRWNTFKRAPKAVALSRKDNSALSEHTCQTNHTIAWNNSKIITTNQRYHQRRCLEAWHINSTHAPLNRDDGGLLPDAYLHLINRWCHYPKSSVKGNSLRRSDHPWWRH